MKFIKDKLKILAVFLVAVLAFSLRFNQVTQIPPSLNWDEVSIGYNAYSILETGRDEWGVTFPVHFEAFGEYKLPVQIYFSIPAIKIFGLNELGIRITPVIYGTLTVLLLFFLAQEIFQNYYISLMSEFLLAISPWHIQLTRASFESSFSILWVNLGIWFFVKGFKNPKWWIWSMLPFAISIYTYNATRVFTPIFLAILLWIYRKELLQKIKMIMLALALLAVLMMPLLPYYLGGQGNSRYKLVSITDDPGLIPRIDQNRNNSHLPGVLPRLIHNRVTYIAYYFTSNYLAHYTPDFLFISGAPHKQHHVQGMGELYLFQAPFLLLGIYLLFKSKQKFRWMILAWILLSAVPASVANDSIPQALRTLIVASVYQIVTAYGIYYLFYYLYHKKPKLIYFVGVPMTILVILSFIYYLHLYYDIYPKTYSRDWQYGYMQVVDYIKNHQDSYDQVVLSRNYGVPYIFTLFFLNYPPDKYQSDPNLVRYEAYNWIWVLKFDKYYFPDLGDPGTHYQDVINQNPGRKLLFIGKPGDFPQNKKPLQTISFLNGQSDFVIVDNL